MKLLVAREHDNLALKLRLRALGKPVVDLDEQLAPFSFPAL